MSDPIMIMARIDFRGGRAVMGVHGQDWEDAGAPVPIATYCHSAMPTAVFAFDVEATGQGRGPDPEFLGVIAGIITRIPLFVGGGLDRLPALSAVLAGGASGVCLNSAAVLRPELIDEAVAEFGSEAVAAVVDARPNAALPSGYEVFSHGGDRPSGRDAAAWAAECADRGAGQVVVHAVERAGRMAGFDLDLLRSVVGITGAPVIASGGGGTMDTFLTAVRESGVAGVMASSDFHRRTCTVHEVREYLLMNGVHVVRPTPGPATSGH